MARVVVLSFRLGGVDGVAIEARKWCDALTSLGHDVVTVAGEGDVDVAVRGLALSDADGPDQEVLAEVLESADLVIVENLLSLPLNRAAARVVTELRRGRPTLIRHHDLPWQRDQWIDVASVPDDPAWTHVTINELSRRQLAERGITSRILYNSFDCAPPAGDRATTRASLGITDQTLVLFPTRAIPRKNVGAAFDLCARHDAVLWLLGAAEDGYAPVLTELIATRDVEVRLGRTENMSIHDAYAAADLVVVPSTWEGFGNPVLESVTHQRPLAVHPYPVLHEIESFGFDFTRLDDDARIARELTQWPDDHASRHVELVRRHFNVDELPAKLEVLVDRAMNSDR